MLPSKRPREFHPSQSPSSAHTPTLALTLNLHIHPLPYPSPPSIYSHFFHLMGGKFITVPRYGWKRKRQDVQPPLPEVIEVSSDDNDQPPPKRHRGPHGEASFPSRSAAEEDQVVRRLIKVCRHMFIRPCPICTHTVSPRKMKTSFKNSSPKTNLYICCKRCRYRLVTLFSVCLALCQYYLFRILTG